MLPVATRLFVPPIAIKTEHAPQSNGDRPATLFEMERPSSATEQSESTRTLMFVPSPEIVNGPSPVSETMRFPTKNFQPPPWSSDTSTPFTVTPTLSRSVIFSAVLAALEAPTTTL